MDPHPFSACFPSLPDDAPEFQALVLDIRQHGLLSPIVLFEGQILDGRHRERACRVVGTEPRYIEHAGDRASAHALVWSANACRRDLTAFQRAAARRLWQLSDPEAAATLERRKQEAAERESGGGKIAGRGRKKPGINCSQAIGRAPRVSDLEAREANSTRRAVELVSALPIEEVQRAAAGELREADVRARARRTARAERDGALAAANRALPEGHRRYSVIYADPPWQYEHMISLSREIEEHYPTMSQEDICAMPVPSMAARDCVLFLWVPPSLIQQGLAVMEAWGFGYRTLIIWDKGSIGPGYWVRQQAELLLIGVRGKPATPEPDARPSSMFRAKRGRHSEKPAGMYEIIETMYPNAQRVELFARNRRTGWDGWGNELRG